MSKRVTIEHDGKTYSGTYKVERDFLTVTSRSLWEETMHVAELSEEKIHDMAQGLLGELVLKHKAKPDPE